MSRNKRLVPNDYTVHLSQHDHDKLAPYASTLLNAELATGLRNHAREMGYVFQWPDQDRLRAGLTPSHRSFHRLLPGGRWYHPRDGRASGLPSTGRHLCSRSMALGIRCSRRDW